MSLALWLFALLAGGTLAGQVPFGSFSSFSGGSHPYRSPTGANLLYNQNSSDGGDTINSQHYSGTYSNFDDQAADDFVIPKGRTWEITEVDVTGAYFNGSGPASSENVIFYKDRKGVPGAPVYNGTFTRLSGTGGPNFSLTLPRRGLKLRSGRYWISVIANVDFDVAGEWGWEVNSSPHHKQAMWQNPGGGFDICQTWGTIETCQASKGPDFMFDLKGVSKPY